jgi:hypothetical protein
MIVRRFDDTRNGQVVLGVNRQFEQAAGVLGVILCPLVTALLKGDHFTDPWCALFLRHVQVPFPEIGASSQR